ncbi:hypothetical protein QCA50_009111 [Cerrena zonata]|uniref:Uncharacterized protein n=1 Tax=Cerrena zonata TaxID=2478898 RepID=A0AAW0G671_9APHY
MLRTSKRLPGPKQFVVPERANDVQRSVRKSDVFAPRFFRSEELVWCSLQHPIPSTSGLPKATIKLWPGIIEETSLKTSSSVIDPSLTNGETQELAVQQWTTKKRYHIWPPEEVLQGVRDELHHLVTEFPVEEMGQDQLGRLYEFDPTNEALVNDPSRYRKAVFSYTLGIQIASHIAQYWTPTDEWDYKFTIPPTIVQQTPTFQQTQSLHDMISATMASNAQNKTTPVPPPRFTGDSGLSPDELCSVRSDLLGASVMGMSSIPRTVTQTRYQGLWWGAKRIWQDELVRLKMARRRRKCNAIVAYSNNRY